MAPLLRHRLSQALGLSDPTAPNDRGEGPNSAQSPQSGDVKRSLQELASGAFKSISKTLRAKAHYFYTESERARLEADNDAATRPDIAQKSSRSRLLDSLRKHRSMGSRKCRQRNNADSIDELAKMDPSNIGEQSPSLDVSIPHSTLLEPDCKFPWMGSRNGRDHSARSRALIVDPRRAWPGPVAIAVRRSSRGATGLPTKDLEDAAPTVRVAKSKTPTIVPPDASRRGPSVAHQASQSQASIPPIQRRLSIFKVFRRASGSSSETLEQAISESFDSLEDLPLHSNGGANRATSEDRVPSMGSRDEWDRARADRHRRYQEISEQYPPSFADPLSAKAERNASPKHTPAVTRVCDVDNETVIRASRSESSGSHYPDSEAGTVSGTQCTVEAIKRTGGHQLERTSISIESWTTSPEIAISSPADVAHQSIEQMLQGKVAATDSKTKIDSSSPNSISPRPEIPSTNNAEPDTCSLKSESTAESCAVTSHEPPCYEISEGIHDHHRRLSEHGDTIHTETLRESSRNNLDAPGRMEARPDNTGSTEGSRGPKIHGVMGGTSSALTARNDPVRNQHGLDNASITTGSTTSSLPRLRRMPRTSLFHEEPGSVVPADSEVSSDEGVTFPAYKKLAPEPSSSGSQPIRHDTQFTPLAVESIEGGGQPTADGHLHASDSDSDSSSSVESWLRSHPDFELESDLGRLSNVRTLSAELLRYSSAHSTVPRAEGSHLRSEENIRTHPGPPSRAGTRQSSAEGSTGSDGTSSSRRRESLIPIPVNSSRLNLSRTPTPAAETPSATKTALTLLKSSDAERSSARTPDELTKRSVTGVRTVSSSGTRAPSTDPHRQVRFPDDTPEMLASRSSLTATGSARSCEASSVAGSDRNASPSLHRRRSIPRIPVPKTHQKWSPIRSKRW